MINYKNDTHTAVEDLIFNYLENERLYKLCTIGESYANSAGEQPRLRVTHAMYDRLKSQLFPWIDMQDTAIEDAGKRWAKKHGHKDKYRKNKS